MIASIFRVAVFAVLIATVGAAARAAEIDVRVTQERADGYRAEVIIRNPADRPITDWSLEFSSGRTIERAWGAEMTRTGENRYRFRPDPWTREIAAGGQAKFTIAGPPGDQPLQPTAVELEARQATASTSSTPTPSDPSPAPPEPPSRPVAKPAPSAKQKRTTTPSHPAPSAATVARGTAGEAVEHTLAFKLQSSWESGFTAEVVVVNGSDRRLRPWRLEFALDAEIVEMWNADFRKIGNGRYVVTPKSYNDELDPNGFASFGFKASTAFSSQPAATRLTAVN